MTSHTISAPLSQDDKALLLKLARQSLALAVNGCDPLELALADYSPPLQAQGASFVTLTCLGELRGCIGTVEPYQPLVQDVCEHAMAAALEDYRFFPVRPEELPAVRIEISRLTTPVELEFEHPGDLPGLLRPHVDGVILREGFHRATFLPQVWEKIDRPEEFLDHLCQKMSLPASAWRQRKLRAFTYRVEEFHEEEH
jgi:AmmeMemoRadiSam system protein A